MKEEEEEKRILFLIYGQLMKSSPANIWPFVMLTVISQGSLKTWNGENECIHIKGEFIRVAYSLWTG